MRKRDIKNAIVKYSGNISAIARAFKKERATMYHYLKVKYPELWSDVIQARETMLDNTESALYSQILSGNVTAIIFYLKTQGKKRGWVERVETTGKNGTAIRLNVLFDGQTEMIDQDSDITMLSKNEFELEDDFDELEAGDDA